jgi:spore germination cell wall hydrolase CwlJ-like protein
MKIITKIMIGVNIAVVATASSMYFTKHSEDTLKENQTQLIIAEVTEKLETAKQVDCLAKNIYHEARNDGLTGQRAVAWATMNRIKSEKYPDTICDVVYQAELNDNGIPLRNKCQFSWFCDGKSDTIDDQAAWNVAAKIAEDVFVAYDNETDPTNGAIMYHANYVEPFWVSSYTETARIDSHIFYN